MDAHDVMLGGTPEWLGVVVLALLLLWVLKLMLERPWPQTPKRYWMLDGDVPKPPRGSKKVPLEDGEGVVVKDPDGPFPMCVRVPGKNHCRRCGQFMQGSTPPKACPASDPSCRWRIDWKKGDAR
jgi:hypothetical protein